MSLEGREGSNSTRKGISENLKGVNREWCLQIVKQLRTDMDHCQFITDRATADGKLRMTEKIKFHMLRYRVLSHTRALGSKLGIKDDRAKLMEQSIFDRMLSSLFGFVLSINQPRISKPPGQRFLSFVEFFYSTKTVEMTFKPAIAEMQHEYYDVLQSNDPRKEWKARIVLVRHYWGLIKTLGLSKIVSVAKVLWDIFKYRHGG